MGKIIYDYAIVDSRYDASLEDAMNELGAEGWSLAQTLGKDRVIMSRVRRDESWTSDKIDSISQSLALDIEKISIKLTTWAADRVNLDKSTTNDDEALRYIVEQVVRAI